MNLDTNTQRAQLGACRQVREPLPPSLNSAVPHFPPNSHLPGSPAHEWHPLPDPCTPHRPRKRHRAWPRGERPPRQSCPEPGLTQKTVSSHCWSSPGRSGTSVTAGSCSGSAKIHPLLSHSPLAASLPAGLPQSVYTATRGIVLKPLQALAPGPSHPFTVLHLPTSLCAPVPS